MKGQGRTKPPLAAAIRYNPLKDSAPRLTAKGSGLIAEKIIDLAKKHGIPVREDPALVQVLSSLEIDQEIPPELYRTVAEILAFIYRMNNRWRERKNCLSGEKYSLPPPDGRPIRGFD
ncbi:MAG TPA: EscU/YscU/HrcU family type III secretion system export apparatus switch protein [Syntrophales bacterium]|nr:EscU/YscU/HrcU family type III secretion system export apparatus switch protein [Syntrophales bacterium]